jgi:protein-S-isoprenylcysteine O-methyltransferase Ste14
LTQPSASSPSIVVPEVRIADLQDLLGRALLIVLMAFIAQGCLQRSAVLAAALTPTGFLDLMSELGSLVFAVLVVVLAVIRLPVRGGTAGWGAMASALGGAFVLTIVNHLPFTPLPLAAKALSASLLAIGNVGTVYCLAHLGRSFSVLPQARALVTSGPYAHLRHPLYVAEGIATIGMILPHFGWIAVGVGVTQFALQWRRIRYEEAVLGAAFADYADYAAVTPRFIPRLTRRNGN